MSHHLIDLPYLIDKKKRSKVRYSIILGNLLHLLYLLIKHSAMSRKGNYIKESVALHRSFSNIVANRDLIAEVLRKESRQSGCQSFHEKVEKYLKCANILKERGYDGLLKLMDIVLDLSFHHKLLNPRSLFYDLLGLKPDLHSQVSIAGIAVFKSNPFYMKLKNCRFFILEAERAPADGMAKTVVYLSEVRGITKNVQLGLLTRFSIRGVDANHLVEKQSAKGCVFELTGMFKLYPTVLRMQRPAYKKVSSSNLLQYSVRSMISELYVDESRVSSIMAGETPANILSMVPSISLKGALCIPVAFRGELLEPIGADYKARIRVADLTISAYKATFSVFRHRMYPGEYVFLAFLPFTAPRVCIVVSSFPIGVLENLKPRVRNVQSLNNLFPKIRDVVRTEEDLT